MSTRPASQQRASQAAAVGAGRRLAQVLDIGIAFSEIDKANIEATIASARKVQRLAKKPRTKRLLDEKEAVQVIYVHEGLDAGRISMTSRRHSDTSCDDDSANRISERQH